MRKPFSHADILASVLSVNQLSALSLAEMSLVRPERAMGFAQSEVPYSAQMSISVLTVVVTIVILRGSFSFLADLVRLVRRFVKTQYVDKGVQTEPYYSQLPPQVYINEGSQVFHVAGCHHIGVNGKGRSACTLCRNKW